MTAHELVDAVRVYRAAGFFAREQGSEAELAARIAEHHESLWGEDLAAVDEPVVRDAMLLAHDRDRVWLEDLEGDALAGNDAYAEAVAAWARISSASLDLADVEETWEAEDGPVTVRVVTGSGEEAVLEPTVDRDWLDLSVLAALNELLARADAPRRFHRLDVDEQTALVCALSESERELIEAQRPLAFELA